MAKKLVTIYPYEYPYDKDRNMTNLEFFKNEIIYSLKHFCLDSDKASQLGSLLYTLYCRENENRKVDLNTLNTRIIKWLCEEHKENKQ